MAGWMGWFGGRGDSRESAREAIVGLRQQLLVLTKKEEFLQQKIDDELKRARANATTNKRCRSPLPDDDNAKRFESIADGMMGGFSGHRGVETKEGARE